MSKRILTLSTDCSQRFFTQSPRLRDVVLGFAFPGGMPMQRYLSEQIHSGVITISTDWTNLGYTVGSLTTLF
jgi:hypothetical protein